MHRRSITGVAAISLVALVVAGCSSSGKNSTTSKDNNSNSGGKQHTLVVENNPVPTMTQTFNPFAATTTGKTVNAEALFYEPLLVYNNTKAGHYYPWLAKSYKWNSDGTSITFKLRSGVKWSDGKAFTAADVAYTFSMMQKNKALNYTGVPITGVTTNGADSVTLTFSASQYTNLYNIAGQTYIVPKHVWSKQSDPGKWTNPNPVGTGPYLMDKFTPQGFTLKANPKYWGGEPQVKELSFPAYSSNDAALKALQAGKIDYTGNDINDIQKNFVDKDPKHNHYYFPATNTVILQPNVTKWPFTSKAVRLAVSAGVSREQMSKQGETGYEAPASSSSGLLLPNFAKNLPPSMKNDLSPKPDAGKVKSLMTSAGFSKDSKGYWAKGGKEVAFSVEDPTSYTDYYADAQIVKSNLKPLGFKVSVDGVTPDKWNSDLAAGNFSSTIHWGAGGPSAYTQYDNWLDSNLIANGSGDQGRWKDPATQAALKQFAGAGSPSAVQDSINKLAKIISTQAPVIPVLYGAGWFEYSTKYFTGWPTKDNSFIDPSPNPVNVMYTILQLKPVG
jgi:peptide/nickel transport system substrate-binding protein